MLRPEPSWASSRPESSSRRLRPSSTPCGRGTTQRFFLNIDTAGAGGIAAIDPTANGGAGAATHFYDLATFGISSCGPTGLAVASGARLTVACGSGPVLVLDPNDNGGNGALMAQIRPTHRRR